jgi:hypothetical protein
VVTRGLEDQGANSPEDYRFLKEALAPSYGMAFGLREVDSYQVLKLERARLFQERLAAQGPASPLLNWAGVSTVITRNPGPGPWSIQNMKIVSLSGYRQPLFFEAARREQKVSIRAYQAGKISASMYTDRADVLVFSEAAYPGWRVRLDGKQASLSIFQDTFLAVEVPPGRHEAVFGYVPWTFRAGLLVTLCSLVLIPGLRKPSQT